MNETEDSPASALIAELAADGAFVEAGGFRLDLAKARDKLGAYRLSDPDRYVLLLVEAANLFAGCRSIAFEISRGRTRVTLAGLQLDADELRYCFDALFVDLRELEPAAAQRMRARKQLAAALNSALDGAEGRSTVTAHGSSSARLCFAPGGEPELEEVSSAASEARVVIDIAYPRGIRQQDEGQLRLLFRDARFGERPVYVNGGLLAQGPSGVEVVDAVEIVDAQGRAGGFVGWCPHHLQVRHGVLIYAANGVAIESCSVEGLPRGQLAVVDARALGRDLSGTKLVRGPAFQGLARAALVASASILSAAPGFVHHDSRALTRGARLAAASGGLFALSMLAGPIGPALGLAASGATWMSVSLLNSTRRRHVQDYGRLVVGVVESVVSTRIPITRADGSRDCIVRAKVRVDRGEAEPLDSEIVSSDELRLGMRVYLRVHPKYPEHAVPARPLRGRAYQD